MFSVIVKGTRDPKDADAVKLTLVIYKTGYSRKKKLLLMSGAYTDWDSKAKRFRPDSADNIAKNKLIQQERIKYLRIAEKWRYSDKNWDTLELIHHFDTDQISRKRSVYIIEVIDQLISEISAQKRIGNNKEFSGERGAILFATLKRSLIRFAKSKYNRDFSRYRFRDIDRKFLVDFHQYEQHHARKNDNTGGADRKIKRLHIVYARAKELDTSVCNSVNRYLRQPRFFSKAVSQEIMTLLEKANRSILLKREQLYLELFLFSYYTGGMSGIDVCHMERNWIQSGTIEYEGAESYCRTKPLLS